MNTILLEHILLSNIHAKQDKLQVSCWW